MIRISFLDEILQEAFPNASDVVVLPFWQCAV